MPIMIKYKSIELNKDHNQRAPEGTWRMFSEEAIPGLLIAFEMLVAPPAAPPATPVAAPVDNRPFTKTIPKATAATPARPPTMPPMAPPLAGGVCFIHWFVQESSLI